MSSDAATSAPDHAPVATAATTDASQAASDSKPTQTPSSTDASAAQEQTADDARANGETLTGAAGESESAQADKAAQGGSTATTKDDALTLRALVSSKEAGVIIGRGGATIAGVRTEAGVKAGVSKVVPGVADRILSVGGSLEGVAKAYSLVAQTILENPVPSPGDASGGVAATSAATTSVPTNATTTVRLLISHLLIGSVIGKGGAKIRQIQDASGARMVASKEMLPQSTERIVEVTGTPEGIRLAVLEIAKCLLEDWDRSQGTVLYHPGAEGIAGAHGGGHGALGNGFPVMQGGVLGGMGMGAPFGGRRISSGGSMVGAGGFQRRTSSGGDFGGPGSGPHSRRSSGNAQQTQAAAGMPSTSGGAEQDPNFREQKISIPSDMVGCIIGRGGSKINEIRRLSGSKITIAKAPHDETGERMFVISGLPGNNEKALYLLYNQLESEKNRRVQSVQEEDSSTGAKPDQPAASS